MNVKCRGEAKIADRNIIVYKAFRKSGIFLISPFYEKLFVWFPHITYHCRKFKNTEKSAIMAPPAWSFSKDGFYSVNNWENLEKELGLSSDYNKDMVIRECIIPHGTKYYWYAGEYCSEYLRIISTNNLTTKINPNVTGKNTSKRHRGSFLRNKKFFRDRP